MIAAQPRRRPRGRSRRRRLPAHAPPRLGRDGRGLARPPHDDRHARGAEALAPEPEVDASASPRPSIASGAPSAASAIRTSSRSSTSARTGSPPPTSTAPTWRAAQDADRSGGGGAPDPADCLRAGARARLGRRPPRRQAVEHPHRQRRQRLSRRLRPGALARVRRRRAPRRHARVHGARAGARRAGHARRRSVCARAHAAARCSSAARLPIDPAEALAELPAELPAGLARRGHARHRGRAGRSLRRGQRVRRGARGRRGRRNYPAPRRLAPEVRVRTPFGWTAGAERAEHARRPTSSAPIFAWARSPTPASSSTGGAGALHRAHRLRRGRLERLRQHRAPGPPDRSVGDSPAPPRSSCSCTACSATVRAGRRWRRRSARDNAQALVIAVDHSGFGESRFASDEAGRRARLAARLSATCSRAWLELLGVRDLPTVLAGHSMAGASL